MVAVAHDVAVVRFSGSKLVVFLASMNFDDAGVAACGDKGGAPSKFSIHPAAVPVPVPAPAAPLLPAMPGTLPRSAIDALLALRLPE